eukprot:GHUV01024986.1.p1 GENE.GHUV01024986.1~~GHUV01024986.1.p1  ORF type:complete len:207 (+),score=82.64 GHUV01024986.1:266-886(+)
MPAARHTCDAPIVYCLYAWLHLAPVGRVEPFNESAAQVQRLVSRDRKEFLGNKVDILDKYTSEFGDPDDDAPAAPASNGNATASSSSNGNGASSSSSSSAAVASPFATSTATARPAAVQTKFTGGSTTASPFGSRRSNIIQEPKGLAPDMSPDPIVKQAATPGNFLSRITLTQIVLFCTFSSMILLMLATFSVVLKSGAIRLAGIE